MEDVQSTRRVLTWCCIDNWEAFRSIKYLLKPLSNTMLATVLPDKL